MPAAGPLPLADYYVTLSRGERRPMAELWAFSLRDPLPLIPVPLEPPDSDAPLDLQSAFDSVYEDAGYDYSLDYRRGTTPPLPSLDAEWAAKLIADALHG